MTRDLVVGPGRTSQGSGWVLEGLEMRANSASVFWKTEIAQFREAQKVGGFLEGHRSSLSGFATLMPQIKGVDDSLTTIPPPPLFNRRPRRR